MSPLDPDSPPGPLRKETDASRSTELPVVVFQDDEVVRQSAEIPRVRLLPGRVPESVVLYPVYVLVLGGGLLAARFALTTHEWSAPVILLAWFVLFLWVWFYGVAYRYRRPLLKYTSLLAIVGLTGALSYFSIERAAAQQAMVGPGELAVRGVAKSLYVVAGGNAVALGLLVAHLVFLGRGYRRKKP